MIVRTMDDMREAFERMARHNRLSLSGLNDMAEVGKGVLTRFRRKEAPTKGKGATGEVSPTDLRLSTVLRIIEAAGFEVELRPRTQVARRQRVLNQARGNGETGATRTP